MSLIDLVKNYSPGDNITNIELLPGEYIYENIDKIDRNGMSALMHASKLGYENIAQFLINKNANINIKDHSGLTALMYSSINDYKRIVNKIINTDTKNVNIVDDNRFNALTYAVLNNNIDIALMLVENDSIIQTQFIPNKKLAENIQEYKDLYIYSYALSLDNKNIEDNQGKLSGVSDIPDDVLKNLWKYIK